MADILKDFVPAGEDAGASGEGGFKDFVPAPKPVKHEESKSKQPVRQKKQSQKKQSLRRK